MNMRLASKFKSGQTSRSSIHGERGVTLLELVVVMGILIVMLAVTVFALRPQRNLYRTEDQALRVVNLLRQASQKAITDRQRMRFEIDLTDRRGRVWDENGTVATGDDRVIAETLLDPDTEVCMRQTGNNVSQPTNVAAPPALLHPAVTFTAADGGNLKWSAYLRNDGTVVDLNNNPLSATLMFWQPSTAQLPNTAKDTGNVRAITLSNGAGTVRYWKYNGAAFMRG